jgi:hypothetical protein
MEKKFITPNKIIAVAYIAVIVFAGYQIHSALTIKSTTGMIVVKASKTSAELSITQENHQASIIGTGTARIRIAPGTYLLGAVNSGQQTGSVASVSLKQTTNASLNLNKSIVLRYAGDINFQNTSALTNSGISSSQLEDFEQYIFEFDHAAQTVNIDANSVEPGPHNPNLVQPFTLNFHLTIDNVNYIATLSYTDVNSTSITLFNEAGTMVYSNSPSASISGD